MKFMASIKFLRLYYKKKSVILKIIQFSKLVNEAKITRKQPGIVSGKHRLENMLNGTITKESVIVHQTELQSLIKSG